MESILHLLDPDVQEKPFTHIVEKNERRQTATSLMESIEKLNERLRDESVGRKIRKGFE